MRNAAGSVMALASSGLALLTAGCLGGGSGGFTSAIPYTPADDQTACLPGNDVTGKWKVLANDATFIPGSADIAFFSFNPPSVNTSGLVVFRGRAKGATGSGGGGGGGGAMSRGVFAIDACLGSLTLYTVADTTMPVPAPNDTNASFTEFPSFPRIDIDSGVLATRGQSTPVWTLPDGTKTGTSGVYVSLPTGLSTGIGQLGNVSEFSYMQVPGASTPGIRFDQFPGSPTLTQGRYLVFKGNYTDGTTAETGVYFRDIATAGSPVQRIADTNTPMPNSNTTAAFGSTAPPSAAGGRVVFVGLDNESAPTAGGLYIAPVADQPSLTPLVQIGLTVVPDGSGNPLPENPTFSEIGEGVAFDGRYVVFWGAWNTQNSANLRPITLQCPTEGNAALQAACLQQYPSGQTTMDDPIDQGIFLYDTTQDSLRMVARAGTGEVFQDFLYWNFSGNTGTTGGSSGSSGSGSGGSSGSGSSGSSGSSEASELEPPRWRVSAFAAVDGGHGVIFLGSLQPATDGSPATSGIYGAALTGNTIGPVFKVVAIGDDMLSIDPAAPAGSIVSSLAIERESLRGSWMTITASSLDPAGESWAGVYATFFPGPFHVIPAVPPAAIATLVLGN